MAAPKAHIRTMRTGRIGEDNEPEAWWGSGREAGKQGGLSRAPAALQPKEAAGAASHGSSKRS